MFDFSDNRYNRHIQMPEWGLERQSKLADAKVAVIGAGGVKSTLLLSLAAAGIGSLRIIEFDKVELSNLNRQILYRTPDIGKNKVDTCVRTLKSLNPDIYIEGICCKVNEDNIDELCSGYSFLVEGGESPAGRNLVNNYCLSVNKPFTHASAQFGYGYAFSVIPELKTSCFACLFPNDHMRAQHTGPVPVNVLATSLAGTLGAAEVLKWFMGYQDNMLLNRRLCFSSLLLSEEFVIEEVKRIPDCPSCSKLYSE
jgi:adenylyltransferase/sulfurtransferase